MDQSAVVFVTRPGAELSLTAQGGFELGLRAGNAAERGQHPPGMMRWRAEESGSAVLDRAKILDQSLDALVWRAVTDDGDVQVLVSIKPQGALESAENPNEGVAERAAAQQGQQHTPLAGVSRVKNRSA